MLPAARAGSLLPGTPTGRAGGVARGNAPAIAAVQKGQGLVIDQLDQDGTLGLGVRQVEPDEPPLLWAEDDFAAGDAVPFLREGLIAGVEVQGVGVLMPREDGRPLYWDLGQRRFTANATPGTQCGEVLADWRHPISDFFGPFHDNSAVDGSAPETYIQYRNRRVNTDGERGRAVEFTLPDAGRVDEGDFVTFFSPPAPPARRFRIQVAGGANLQQPDRASPQITLVPTADGYEYITLRADGGVWVQDLEGGIHTVVRVSALRLAYEDVTDRVRLLGRANDRRVPTEAAVRAAVAAGAGETTLAAIAAVQKGQGLVLDKAERGGVLALGVRPVEPGEPPFLWALDDYGAGENVQSVREGLIENLPVPNRPPLVPRDVPLSLYWDFQERRFTTDAIPGGRCGTVSTDWLHPLAAIPAFDENGARDLSGAAVYDAIRNRRINTDGERTGAAWVVLPPSISVAFGDVVTFFSPPATAARRFDIQIEGGERGIRTEDGDFVRRVGFNPSARYEYLTLRADGAFWVVDQNAAIHNVARVSALRMAYEDVTNTVRGAGEADHGRVPTEAAVRAVAVVPPETLFDGTGGDGFTILSDTALWLLQERIVFTRALVEADDDRMLSIAASYRARGQNKHLSIQVPAWQFRRMEPVAGGVETSPNNTLTHFIQRPSSNTLNGWAEAVLHLGRWRTAGGKDGIWFNAGSEPRIANILKFRCRVDLR